MRRRSFLSLGVTAGIAGCTELAVVGDGQHSIGATVEFGKIEVTAEDVMTTREIKLTFVSGERTATAPSNGVIALFHVRAHNTDFTSQEGPTVNPKNYEYLEEEGNQFILGGVNDIRVNGSDEAGHLPEIQGIELVSYERAVVNGNALEVYPPSVTGDGPRLDPDGSVDGWVFAVIPKDATPELQAAFDGKEAIWTAEGEPLDTPTEEKTEVVSF